MPSKKLLWIGLLIIFLSVYTSAFSIDSENPISQGSQWDFTVDFSSQEVFNEAKVFVDGETVLVALNYSGNLQVIGSESSSKVSSYNISGQKITVFFAGMSSGTHTIMAADYYNDSVVEEQSVEINFFEPISYSDKEELQNKIDSLNTTINNLEDTISSMQTQINNKDETISSLERQNESLSNSISSLQANISLLEQNGKTSGEVVSQIKSDLDVLLTEREESQKSPVAGFLAFSSSNPGFVIGVIALILIVVVVLFVKSNSRGGGSSIYSGQLFSNIKSKFKRSPRKEKETDVKWPLGSEKAKEEKFSLGDLVKKN